MLNREALEDLYDYTDFTWASYERVVRTLPEGVLTRPVDGSGWPSLFDALKHFVSTYDGWMNETFGLGPVVVEDVGSIETWEQLVDLRANLRATFRRLLDSTPDDKLFERMTKAWEAGTETLYMSIADLLAHVLLHERGHHGDINTLLDRLGAQQAANDYAIYLYFKGRRGSP
jgi:uncharacterized damage-inducible protein DinB